MTKTTPILRCPNCNSKSRQRLYQPVRDNIKSDIVKCKKCNLVYNGITVKSFDKKEFLEDLFLGKDEQARKRLPYSKAYMQALKKISKGKAHLDIGSGSGILLEAGTHAGFRSVGIEPFKPSVAIAKSNGMRVAGPSLKEARLPAKSVDVITAIEVIEHFIKPHEEFSAMARVLKDDGLIVMQTANQDSLATLIKKGGRAYYYYDHFLYFSPKTLNMMLNKAGLKVVKARAGIVPFWQHLKWARNWSERLLIMKIHAARAVVLNRPILSSMTVFVKKV